MHFRHFIGYQSLTIDFRRGGVTYARNIPTLSELHALGRPFHKDGKEFTCLEETVRYFIKDVRWAGLEIVTHVRWGIPCEEILKEEALYCWENERLLT